MTTDDPQLDERVLIESDGGRPYMVVAEQLDAALAKTKQRLADLRHVRTVVNAEIKVLVQDENRLVSMSRIANRDEPEGPDDD